MTSNITITKIVTYRHGIYFHVTGSTDREYIVDYNFKKGWICDCPDHLFRHGFCKHMQACQEYLAGKGLRLSSKVWYDDPKSDRVFEDTLATEVAL